MADREKVIKGLEMHEKKRAGVGCLECPYAEAEGATDDWCIRGLHRDIIALLKEQEAKPVEVCGQMFTVEYGHCPTCGKGMDSDTYPRWCGFCGQAVKWE